MSIFLVHVIPVFHDETRNYLETPLYNEMFHSFGQKEGTKVFKPSCEFHRQDSELISSRYNTDKQFP